MRVQVKFFAIFREMMGVKSEAKDIADGTTVEQLWREYAARSPRATSARAAYAVNQSLVNGSTVLHDGDEVGFLPPVSGGAEKMNRKDAKSAKPKKKKPLRPSRLRGDAIITRRALNINTLVKRVEFPGAGAILVFSGVVRDNAHGKAVKHLEYEAYPEMAEKSLCQIIAEIKERWADTRVAIAHRIGKMKIGESSLLIVIASPHRPEGYAASRYAIERIKAILPVWKKEFTRDGDHWVEGPIAGDLPASHAEAIARQSDATQDDQAGVLATLAAFNAAVTARDLKATLALFASDAETFLLASEANEGGAGIAEIENFFKKLYARPVTYSWTWNTLSVTQRGNLAWIYADGAIQTQTSAGLKKSAPYRITGVLERRGDKWMWLQYHGSEPVLS